ncbi:MAG: hypothetical protein JNL21_03855 [Myxococcales bacterium]|nr:hypothetical protein [Myxococcales bacterium]
MSGAARLVRVGALVTAVGVAACGANARASSSSAADGSLGIVAEGPCARLSLQAMGDRRFVVFGDTGYDLELWTAGEEVGAAQAIAELADGTAYLDDRWTAGLDVDGRGYLPATVQLGGSSERAGWLRLTRTRYAPHGTGKLFVRESTAYARGADHWEPLADASGVGLPPAAQGLPPPPFDSACGAGLRFLPLAHTLSPAGGLLVAGRCQGESITPTSDTTLLVAHGRPGDKAWTVERTTPRARLEGHVNAALFARGDDDVYLAAYEPFEAVAGRQAFLAHWDGSRWTEIDAGVEAGIMSIAGTRDGRLYLATGEGVYERDVDGTVNRLALPAPTFVRAGAKLHFHTVHVAGDELWAEASLKVSRRAAEGQATEEVWASVLYGPGRYGHYHCDAKERAEDAFVQSP